jgi:hypothetical protein
MPGAFKRAVRGTAALAHAYRDGLQAIRNADLQRMSCREPRRLTGSVDVDEANGRQLRQIAKAGIHFAGERVMLDDM